MKKIIYNILNLTPQKQSEKEKTDLKQLTNFVKKHPVLAGIWFAFLGGSFGSFMSIDGELWYLGFFAFAMKMYSGLIFADYFLEKICNTKNIVYRVVLTTIFYLIISYLSHLAMTWLFL